MNSYTKYFPIEIESTYTATYDSRIMVTKSDTIQYDNSTITHPTYGNYKIFNISSKGYDDKYVVGGAILNAQHYVDYDLFFNPILVDRLILDGANIYRLGIGQKYIFTCPIIDFKGQRIYDAIEFVFYTSGDSIGAINVYGRSILANGDVPDTEESQIISSYDLPKSYFKRGWDPTGGICLYMYPRTAKDIIAMIDGGCILITGDDLYKNPFDVFHWNTTIDGGIPEKSLQYLRKIYWIGGVYRGRFPALFLPCYRSSDDGHYYFFSGYLQNCLSDTLSASYLIYPFADIQEYYATRAARYCWTYDTGHPEWGYEYITGDIQKFEEGVKYVGWH